MKDKVCNIGSAVTDARPSIDGSGAAWAAASEFEVDDFTAAASHNCPASIHPAAACWPRAAWSYGEATSISSSSTEYHAIGAAHVSQATTSVRTNAQSPAAISYLEKCFACVVLAQVVNTSDFTTWSLRQHREKVHRVAQ